MTNQDSALTLITRSGLELKVRPASPEDDAALAAFFEHVTKDDLRYRFLSAMQKVPTAQIEAMTHVDHRQNEDFMVYEAATGELIANAMLAADKSLETAEVAIAVHSDFKGRGIESALLEYVTRFAKTKGIRKLLSIESRENHCAIELERKMGFTMRGIDDDPMLVVLEARL